LAVTICISFNILPWLVETRFIVSSGPFGVEWFVLLSLERRYSSKMVKSASKTTNSTPYTFSGTFPGLTRPPLLRLRSAAAKAISIDIRYIQLLPQSMDWFVAADLNLSSGSGMEDEGSSS
jgi:hypothetical protein